MPKFVVAGGSRYFVDMSFASFFYRVFQLSPCAFDRFGISGADCVAHVCVGVSGQLRIDWQVDEGAVVCRQLYGKLHPFGTARHGGDVLCILVGRQDVLQNGAELDLAQYAASFHVREDALEVSHTLCEPLHLPQAFVNLFELLADLLERVGHAFVQGFLQLFVDRLPHNVELGVVVRSHLR